MNTRYLTLISSLAVFLAMVSFSSAQAPQQRGPVELPSVAHAISAPLRTSTPISNKKSFGPARVIPLRRPDHTGLATNGGGEAGPAAPAVGNWSDADVQTTYNPSQLTLQKVFGGVNFTGQIPPDENLSVGINTTGGTPQTQIVQTVNTSYEIFDASGTGVASGYLNGLFANLTSSMCSTVNGGDPIVLFDKLDGRWLISPLAYNSTFTDNHLCLAMSQTSDAGGVYDVYDISFGSNLPDYPKLAIWPDGIYFSANIYINNGATEQFTGAQACSFPRTYVTNPPPSGNITFACSSGTDAGIYNILPADLENPPGTASLPSGHDYYLQYLDNVGPGSGNDLRLYQFDPATGSLNTVSDLTVNDFHDACGGGTCIPQEGTTQLLDSLGDRLMYRLSYRVYDTYSQIVANHSVQINSSDNQTGVRWYRLRSDQGGPFYVDKESTFSPDVSTYRWMAGIAQNKHGDLGLGYSTSGLTSVPGISVTGLLNGTDSGMELGQSMYNGSDQSYQGTYSRWGDYSSMSVDPTDDCSFWYTNEYVKPPVLSFDFLWNTVIGKFSVGDCSGSSSSSFSFSVNAPSSQTVIPGGGASYSITVTPASGYNGMVNLSVDQNTCPSGATCTLSTTAANFSTSSTPVNTTLTVNTGSSTPAQSYSVVVKGTDSSNSTLTGQTSVQLAVTDFSLASNPASQTVTAGTNAVYTITANALNGFTGTVNLSVGSTCPSGMTCAFGSASIAAGGSTSLTVSGTSGVTSSSTFTITITGTSSGLTHATTAGLTVNPPPPDFSIAATPPSQTVNAGTGTTYTVSITPSNGFTGSVTLNVSGIPSGATAGFSPNPATSSSTLTISTGSSTPSGTYTLTITCTSGSLSHTTTVGLTVNGTVNADFSLSASSATITVPVNSSSTDTIMVTPSGGFTGSVSLSLSGLPRRTSSSFTVNPISITSSSAGSSILTISASRSATAGTYGLALMATSGSLTKTMNLTLIIGTTATPDFSISASPSSQTVTSGSGTSYTVSISGSGGFSDNVTLSATGLPNGAAATFSTNPVAGGSGSSTMNLTTTSGTTPNGTYTLTITGTSTSATHSTTVTLVVGTAGGGDFSLSASPGSITLHGGGTANYTVSVTPASGANPTVGFTVTGLPGGGTTAGFNPTSVTGSGSTTLSVVVPSGVTGTYTLTITGNNSQGTSHTVSVALKLH